VILVAVDAAWLLGGALRAAEGDAPDRRRRAALVVAAAAACVTATFLASPVFLDQARAVLGAPKPFGLGAAPLTFLGFGLTGEAMLPPPWTPIALLALPCYVVVALRTWHKPGSAWIASVALGWLVATQIGVWHPRYALMLWTLLTARAVDLALAGSAPRLARWAARATVGWLAMDLLLTVGQRSFLKGDLNSMAPDACGAIFSEPSDLVLAPYPRTAAQIVRACGRDVPVVTAGWIRHYEDDDPALTASIAGALPRARQLVLVTVPTGGSTLAGTFDRVRHLVDARCTARSHSSVGADPFGAWKGAGAGERPRYEIARYTCP
jgi:hypothetical protein